MNKRSIIGNTGAGCMSVFIVLLVVFIAILSIMVLGGFFIAWVIV